MEELKLCSTCKKKEMVQIEVTERKDRVSFIWTAKVICLDCFTQCSCHGFHFTEDEARKEVIKQWQSRPIEDALTATIAQKDAEIERLREALKRILDIKPSNSPSMAARIYDMKEIAKQALKEVNND